MYSRLRRRSDFRPARTSSTERTGPGFSAFKASADRPAQKNATSDVISSQPIACPPTNHEAGHVFLPTRKVGSAFFRTHVYCDYSPCFADPALLSVVEFLWTVKLPVKHHTKNVNTDVIPSQPIACPSEQSRSRSHVFTDQEGRKCVLQNSCLL